jgi:proteasome lid subunit RPN8/RPN11
VSTIRARQPNKVRFKSERQLLPLIVVHSHPWSDTVPSDDDLRWAAHYGWDVLAIFSVPTDELRLWRPDGDSFAEISFDVS